MPNISKIQAGESPVFTAAPQPLQRMRSFSPYKQGKAEIAGLAQAIKLSSNENPFGPSEAALEAFRQAARNLHRYPDGSQSDLRLAIARVHNLDPDRIVCGNGSEELIGLLMRCYLGKDDELLLSRNYFPMCAIYGKAQAAKIVLAPEKDFTIDVDSVLARITPKTRVLSIANPNNPTGTYLKAAELRRFIEGVPKNILVILDGAYAEYADRDDFDDGMAFAHSSSNVVVTRTFSKIYGLAGLRVGWAYGPAPIMEVVNRLRTPFNVNGPALAAAAAAIADQSHVKKCREHNARWLIRIREALGVCGLYVVPSVTNFYLLDFGSLPGKTASKASAVLESKGIIARPGESDRFLRVTVGLDAENQAVIDVLTGYLVS
ncbi:MAG TPA: histidinol-phosphate transaminase [Xanthomonadales bacterium]|nr:histidinol-phosphate transaminase [Xanthomonadales bacterium]